MLLQQRHQRVSQPDSWTFEGDWKQDDWHLRLVTCVRANRKQAVPFGTSKAHCFWVTLYTHCYFPLNSAQSGTFAGYPSEKDSLVTDILLCMQKVPSLKHWERHLPTRAGSVELDGSMVWLTMRQIHVLLLIIPFLQERLGWLTWSALSVPPTALWGRLGQEWVSDPRGAVDN